MWCVEIDKNVEILLLKIVFRNSVNVEGLTPWHLSHQDLITKLWFRHTSAPLISMRVSTMKTCIQLSNLSPFQCRIRQHIAKSCAVSQLRDLCLGFSIILQAYQQHRHRVSSPISKRYDNSILKLRNSWDLTIRRIIGYWNGLPDSDRYEMKPVLEILVSGRQTIDP